MVIGRESLAWDGRPQEEPVQYRRFGSLDYHASALGFGAMRLPTCNGDIDEPLAIRMLRYAIDHGVNYVDTAWPYHGGKSEVMVGRALGEGYRERTMLATKLPSWEVKTTDDFDRFLDAQLERLATDHIDFYLLHSMNRHSWPRLRDLGVREWAERAMAGGHIRHLGFSYHDTPEAFAPIIDGYDWAMCQIQLNFMDPDGQAGVSGLRYATAKGIAVVIMEPLFGGKLVDPPTPVQAIWDTAAVKRSPVDWALRWLWNQPGVSLVLSGMSSQEQVEENAALAAAPDGGALTPDELILCDQVRAAYQALTLIPCTACGYCKPCPQGVDIPQNLSMYNDGVVYDKPEVARSRYAWLKYAFEVQHLFDRDMRAANCIQCAECEARCPQSIPISVWMPVVDEVLGGGKPWVMEPGG